MEPFLGQFRPLRRIEIEPRSRHAEHAEIIPAIGQRKAWRIVVQACAGIVGEGTIGGGIKQCAVSIDDYRACSFGDDAQCCPGPGQKNSSGQVLTHASRVVTTRVRRSGLQEISELSGKGSLVKVIDSKAIARVEVESETKTNGET